MFGCRYVGEKDLAFFKYRAIEDGPCEGCSKWEIMFEKDLPGFLKYTAWRRTTPSGVAEYKSITVCPDATAEEFMDMYLDDDFRRNWVSRVASFGRRHIKCFDMAGCFPDASLMYCWLLCKGCVCVI